MNAPPTHYRTTYEEIRRHWPELTADIGPLTPNGATLHWCYQPAAGAMSFAAIRRLGKRPRTRARNLLKRSGDLWVLGRIGGNNITILRVASETRWRGGVLNLVPDEVVDTIASQIGEGE
jgi:hypothetical protein